MDNNTTNAKASKVLKALAQVESELRAEGQTKDADNIHKGLGELTVGSLVRLHDLLVTHETKAEALKSLGIDA